MTTEFENGGTQITAPECTEDAQNQSCQCKYDEMAIRALEEKVLGLQDLFLRRLSDDRQKSSMISTLEAGAKYAFIEPFLTDLILLLDRMEKTEDAFVISLRDELLDILERRSVKKIQSTAKFDPALNKAVKVITDSEVEQMCVSAVIRNGYTYAGRVVRPVEVVISKPAE